MQGRRAPEGGATTPISMATVCVTLKHRSIILWWRGVQGRRALEGATTPISTAMVPCLTVTLKHQSTIPLVEGGAGKEGSLGRNNSNINGDGTLSDCDTEAPINYPLATAMDKATGSDGKVGTPSFAKEIPRINIGASEGQGTVRFAFVNNRMEILTSPLATTTPPATIQLRGQDAVLTLPSATSPKSGKNPPDLAGPVPRKLQHKNI